MSHTQIGEINIFGASTILIAWSWPMLNDGNAALWASQYVQFRHDIGYFGDYKWKWLPIPRVAGRDQTWVEWKPGEGITEDIFTEHGGRSVVAPDRSASISGNFNASFVGSLQLPGPAQNANLRDFWDEASDQGAQFHLNLSIYQQDRANARMGDSKRLDEHEFDFLFGVTTDTPPLRVLEAQRDGAESPFVGIYTQ